MHIGPATDGADHARALIGQDWRIRHRLRIGDAVPSDLQFAVSAHHVEQNRFGAIEAEHVKPFEWDGLSDNGREPRHQFRQCFRLSCQAGHGREHR